MHAVCTLHCGSASWQRQQQHSANTAARKGTKSYHPYWYFGTCRALGRAYQGYLFKLRGHLCLYCQQIAPRFEWDWAETSSGPSGLVLLCIGVRLLCWHMSKQTEEKGKDPVVSEQHIKCESSLKECFNINCASEKSRWQPVISFWISTVWQVRLKKCFTKNWLVNITGHWFCLWCFCVGDAPHAVQDDRQDNITKLARS